ncbi:MAG: aldose 1-epimerase family protein [Clostridia bacterium]|nr:aldose 1-epimerase family protein [Clostridia bacterium]
MIYTLKNEFLTVQLSDKGAEIVSVKSADGCEYIWQGDAKYWAGQAPLMFPICGRLFGGKYTYDGTDYEMTIHGFARHSVFSSEKTCENRIRFTLTENAETLAVYPFKFELSVEYCLSDKTLFGGITVKNTDEKVLPFAVGLHPGFNVPLSEGGFEDCYIEFSEPCSPDKIGLSDTCFLTGKNEAFYLEGGKRLSLRHSLFDNDAIFLARNCTEVCLRSEKSDRYVRFTAEDFPYLGLWHAPRTDAPYVCIEPWCGLPSYDGEIDDFSKKRDLFRLVAGDKKELSYSLMFG